MPELAHTTHVGEVVKVKESGRFGVIVADDDHAKEAGQAERVVVVRYQDGFESEHLITELDLFTQGPDTENFRTNARKLFQDIEVL